MSFGFSIGDFLAVGRLIADITSSLSAAGGAKSDYQELLRELESLRKALVQLDQLNSHSVSSPTLDSIKYALLSCRYPLEQFLAKVRKYEQSLNQRGKTNVFQGTADKLRWTFGSSEEVKKLQSYLNIQIGTINILLAQYGLERMDIAEQRAETQHLQIRERLDHTRSLVQETKKSTLAQALAIKNVGYMLGSLYEVVCGPMKVSLESLGQAVAKICVSTQQIYSVVLDIRESMATVDTRWTYFQAPLILEDALGRKIPVPSEYDYGTLEVIIKHRFRVGIGSQDVQLGNYELFKTKRRGELVSPNTCLLPGTEITMAIIIVMPAQQGRCPMSRCSSPDILAYPRGGMICSECNVWFDQATKQRRSLFTLSDLARGKIGGEPDKRFKDGENTISSTGTHQTTRDDSDSLKNIKLGSEKNILDGDFPFFDFHNNKTFDIRLSQHFDAFKAITARDSPIYCDSCMRSPNLLLISRYHRLFQKQRFDTPGIFLPPGYRIECKTHGDEEAIRFTIPGGAAMVCRLSDLRTASGKRE